MSSWVLAKATRLPLRDTCESGVICTFPNSIIFSSSIRQPHSVQRRSGLGARVLSSIVIRLGSEPEAQGNPRAVEFEAVGTRLHVGTATQHEGIENSGRSVADGHRVIPVAELIVEILEAQPYSRIDAMLNAAARLI